MAFDAGYGYSYICGECQPTLNQNKQLTALHSFLAIAQLSCYMLLKLNTGEFYKFSQLTTTN